MVLTYHMVYQTKSAASFTACFLGSHSQSFHQTFTPNVVWKHILCHFPSHWTFSFHCPFLFFKLQPKWLGKNASLVISPSASNFSYSIHISPGPGPFILTLATLLQTQRPASHTNTPSFRTISYSLQSLKIIIFMAYYILYYECECFTRMCVCALCALPAVLRGQKRASDVLGLALQMVVSHHTSTGKRTQILCNSNRHS